MGKIITIFGAPNSGKSTAGLNIAKEIYFTQKKSVLFLSPDLTVPTISFLFPNRKDSELFSIGKALDHTDIIRENVMRQTVYTSNMENLGFLGYKAGENKYTYPRPTPDKVTALFRCMREIAEYSVIDCSNDTDDLISTMALSEADFSVQIIKADIKAMIFFTSNASRFAAVQDKSIGIINISDRDIYLPVDEVRRSFKNVHYVLPYSAQLKQQSITGTLTDPLMDSKYRAVIRSITKDVT